MSEKRILLAYQMGIFPWFAEDEPILWWSPDPRLLLYPADIYISKRLKRTIRQNTFKITCDTDFQGVISACASVRVNKFQGTWIGKEMIDAYCRLFDSGYAHSVEVWQDQSLAGGLYGLSLGGSFFGESMFSLVSNTSKIALAALCCFLEVLSFDLIDCQVKTDHLIRMGAVEVSRSRFLKKLHQSIARPTLKGNWKVAFREFYDGSACFM